MSIELSSLRKDAAFFRSVKLDSFRVFGRASEAGSFGSRAGRSGVKTCVAKAPVFEAWTWAVWEEGGSLSCCSRTF